MIGDPVLKSRSQISVDRMNNPETRDAEDDCKKIQKNFLKQEMDRLIMPEEMELINLNNDYVTGMKFRTMAMDNRGSLYENQVHSCSFCRSSLNDTFQKQILPDCLRNKSCEDCCKTLQLCRFCSKKFECNKGSKTLFDIISNKNENLNNKNSLSEEMKTIDPHETYDIGKGDFNNESFNLQIKLDLLEQESKSFHDSLLLKEMKIRNFLREIDEVISQKKVINQKVKYFQMMLNQLEEKEKDLKDNIIETRNSIEGISRNLETIAFSRDEIENKLEEFHLLQPSKARSPGKQAQLQSASYQKSNS